MKMGSYKIITLVLLVNFAAIFLSIDLPTADAQTKRRIKISEVKKNETSAGRYYALLIAVSNFASNSGIQSLDFPLRDAERVQQILTSQYTFEPGNVTLLRNPNRAAIIRALDHLSQKLTPEDNLLIFYAGHGFWDTRINQGFWLPSDARKDDRADWLSNSTLRDYIGGIRTKHTLLVADACFSGGIFKTRAAFDNSTHNIQELYKLPSRNAMTSGGMTEVPDKSVFVAYFLKRLQENREAYLSAETLFSSMRKAVISNSPTAQIPQYGEIREVGDEGGDFIFVRRNEPPGSNTASSNIASSPVASSKTTSSNIAIPRTASSNTEASERLAASLYLEDKFTEAESAYRKAIKAEPENAKLHNMLGAVLKAQKRYKEAESEYKKALKLEPGRAEWHTDLGQILFLQKKYAKAEGHFRQAIQLEPKNPSIYEHLGRVLYLSGEHAEAIVTLKQAISLAPNVTGAHYYLGLTFVSQKQYTEAEAEFNLVLRINPNDAEARKAIEALPRMK